MLVFIKRTGQVLSLLVDKHFQYLDREIYISSNSVYFVRVTKQEVQSTSATDL